ncbi:MAG: type II secretion system F family protein [Thermomicrobiales bacterium]
MLEALQVNSLLISVLAFGAVFLTVFAVNAVVSDVGRKGARSAKERLDREFHSNAARERARGSVLVKNYLTSARNVLEPEDRPLSIGERIQLWIEQAGMTTSLGGLIAISVLLALATVMLTYFATGSYLVGISLAAIVSIVPFLRVHVQRAKRLEQLRQQLPDAFDLMSRVLRSGQTISQGLQAVAEEFGMPISSEFGYCYEQMNLGLPPDTALRDLARRTGVLEIRIFVLAVVIHRQAGGNLSELLDKLAGVVRERFRIRGMINSLTAQGRLQAGILLSLPPLMFLLLVFLSPEYELMLFDYPWMIAAALGSMTVGALWIRRVVNFDY